MLNGFILNSYIVSGFFMSVPDEFFFGYVIYITLLITTTVTAFRNQTSLARNRLQGQSAT